MERYLVEISPSPYVWRVVFDTPSQEAALERAELERAKHDYVRIRCEHDARISHHRPINKNLNSNREVLGTSRLRDRRK